MVKCFICTCCISMGSGFSSSWPISSTTHENANNRPHTHSANKRTYKTSLQETSTIKYSESFHQCCILTWEQESVWRSLQFSAAVLSSVNQRLAGMWQAKTALTEPASTTQVSGVPPTQETCFISVMQTFLTQQNTFDIKSTSGLLTYCLNDQCMPFFSSTWWW